MNVSHFAGECFLSQFRNITHSWVHLASGSQAFSGGKRTFSWSALRLSVVVMTRAFLPTEFLRLYQPPRPSEDGNFCDLCRGIGLGSTCHSLVATMLVAYASRSSTKSSMYHAMSSAGNLR